MTKHRGREPDKQKVCIYFCILPTGLCGMMAVCFAEKVDQVQSFKLFQRLILASELLVTF